MLKEKMLKELELKNNVCFKHIIEENDIIHIFKSKHNAGTTREVSEICNINSKLEKYKKYFKIKVSVEEVIIELN
ncbi:MAG: hypothetical protein WA945_02355 [Arcobacteraceae bacterium]